MEQLIVRVADKDKAEMLSKILSALDFVKSVEIREDQAVISDNESDFFALAGLWENRNITAESIRPDQYLTKTKSSDPSKRGSSKGGTQGNNSNSGSLTRKRFLQFLGWERKID